MHLCDILYHLSDKRLNDLIKYYISRILKENNSKSPDPKLILKDPKLVCKFWETLPDKFLEASDRPKPEDENAYIQGLHKDFETYVWRKKDEIEDFKNDLRRLEYRRRVLGQIKEDLDSVDDYDYEIIGDKQDFDRVKTDITRDLDNREKAYYEQMPVEKTALAMIAMDDELKQKIEDHRNLLEISEFCK
ncbi:hypothetical protein HYFRA_00000206 [Hymenoscyphus fraxineus]|uniref:Uncharacterized protein n=1 Tax=Hymenoscyphus fraxineus TaxID=746836 RepID=A0A9N9L151_9HELO|nr:hypothetical protein HYFRA_00000206 [Hymenoscyphus fraxineus]